MPGTGYSDVWLWIVYVYKHLSIYKNMYIYIYMYMYIYIYIANRERTVVIEKVSVLNDNDIDETFVGKRKILASAICL